MKLLVGLGNPGEKYKSTRHNIGFTVLDKLAEKLQNSKYLNFQENKKLKSQILKIDSLVFAKPTTFMNNSGEAVFSLYTYYKIQNTNLFVIHDDLDIKLGEYKIQLGIGPKDHNGLNSIYEKLGSKDFWHVRVGVDNRERMENGKWKMESFTSGEQYVLQKFSNEEKKVLDKVISEVVNELLNKLQN